FRETGCAPEQLCRRPANSLGCDLCHELTSELQANVANAIPAGTRSSAAGRATALPLAKSWSQGLDGNHWVHRRDPPGVGRSDGARVAPEPWYVRHPTKNPR